MEGYTHFNDTDCSYSLNTSRMSSSFEDLYKQAHAKAEAAADAYINARNANPNDSNLPNRREDRDIAERARADALAALQASRPAPDLPGQPVSVADRLKSLGVTARTADLNYLIDKEPAKYGLLLSVDAAAARTILATAASRVKSATRAAIGEAHGFILDGFLTVNQGQPKSSFYYAFGIKDGLVWVAKGYRALAQIDFDREVASSALIGEHESVVSFEKSFCHKNTFYIIMPFFPRSALDLLLACGGTPMPVQIVSLIGVAVAKALLHVHEKGLCFGDVKPSNIMLADATGARPVLIDLGAVVKIDEPLIEATSLYALDFSTEVGVPELDWTCLGATLCQLLNYKLTNSPTRRWLIEQLDGISNQHTAQQLAIFCLNNDVYNLKQVVLSFDV